ncbi:TVP38/TMEM64 family protein [Pseudogulbenkiania subflava]|uniref:TVP38/TMEM64 family membrane protein n=1 Tax=Pseudogulbenkiania subflava DSM 22618 TaxID=1123014 RepID=A0A1Y6BYU7_9NEIS|nr:TVP38/TMEM64 family protein [Pseudogulbenkiania subflava]SMF23168.1 Uncharacterized membrane protein YdjX, TVP38/TMEM64 family, SNARE-associated domain [Pseudogulbenkiania subflava DSM 22618]SMF32521.1 Uncharacterized membrane protein YdjX, TVP38/TMEM64 family, SNARE-associated domain [Pseudogulbenkiania subflava DSM 22618]SMF47603.1 Uncharacterized membrane protein YdjX, TVP38/TMEM64 family, SNARE-associated domain [Pseudogulbenkiania subflava DSM 22618]
MKPDRTTPTDHRPSSWRRLEIVAVLLAVGGCVFLVLWLVPHRLSFDFPATAQGIVRWVRSLGAWGVVGSLLLMVAHSFLPFPAEMVALANGMVYGPFWGAVITWCGAMLGAATAFGLTRRLGRPFVERWMTPGSRRELARWSQLHGATVLLACRLMPAIAFNLINYAAALAGLSWWTFLWTTALGILPLTILLAVLGDRILTIPFTGWLLMSLAVAMTGWLLIRLRARARRSTDSSNGTS